MSRRCMCTYTTTYHTNHYETPFFAIKHIQCIILYINPQQGGQLTYQIHLARWRMFDNLTQQGGLLRGHYDLTSSFTNYFNIACTYVYTYPYIIANEMNYTYYTSHIWSLKREKSNEAYVNVNTTLLNCKKCMSPRYMCTKTTGRIILTILNKLRGILRNHHVFQNILLILPSKKTKSIQHSMHYNFAVHMWN
jgi:hypothetical protein